MDEVGVLVPSPRANVGSEGERIIVREDPRYFRPTEVETLFGDATRAREKLGWQPRSSFRDLVAEMARSDLAEAERDSLVVRHGFPAPRHHE